MQTLVTILQEAFDKRVSTTETQVIILAADFEFLLNTLRSTVDNKAAVLALSNFNIDCTGFSVTAGGSRQLSQSLSFHNYTALKKNKGFV